MPKKTHNRTHSNDFHMLISNAHMASLDKLRKKESDLPSRAEMLRRLIERAK